MILVLICVSRVGRDMLRCFLPQAGIHFNPRAPCGARRQDRSMRLSSRIFQSTRPRGARHRFPVVGGFLEHISIHAPAWGATLQKQQDNALRTDFNPRARVGRDSFRQGWSIWFEISIHAPAWGATVPVYTGLITAVALYFSRTSFLAMLLQAFFVAKSSV